MQLKLRWTRQGIRLPKAPSIGSRTEIERAINEGIADMYDLRHLMSPLAPTAVLSLLIVEISFGTKISTIDCVALAQPSTLRFFQ